MGRPIKKIHIGERGTGNAGGEGVASITISGTADIGIIDNDPLVISEPDLVDGVQAAGYVVSAGGDIDSVVISEAGTGYTSAPTVTTLNQATRTLTAVLTTNGPAVISASAFVAATNLYADIKSQKSTTRYRVATAEGTLDCTLVQATPSAVGEMAIVATDSAGGTYWVQKLFNNTVILTQSGTGPWEFATNDKVKWADAPVLNDAVKITS